MEVSNNYNIKEYDIIVWFYRILLAVVFVTISSLFLLKVNDSVPITEGEIVSVQPEVGYRSPFDAKNIKVYVKEGQFVQKGDTLAIMSRRSSKAEHAKIIAEEELLKKRLRLTVLLQAALEDRSEALNISLQLSNEQYVSDQTRFKLNIKYLKQQYTLSASRLQLGKEKFNVDSTLFIEGAISRAEYISSKHQLLELKEKHSALANDYTNLLGESKNVYGYYKEQQDEIELKALELKDKAQELMQQKFEVETEILKLRETLKTIHEELLGECIIAEKPGTVNYLFSTKQVSNLVPKGELIVSVVPETDSFYAKVIIDERDIAVLKEGQKSWLKLDSYHYLEHGLIKGELSYVSRRKEEGKFYALIQVVNSPDIKLRSGYSIYGEIVLQRMPLYKFLFRKLFKSYNN